MSDWFAFLGAVAALLAAPGPTNALLAAAGVQRGVRAGASLLLAVIAGYGLGVTGWIVVLEQATNLHSAVPVAAKLVAVGFLLWSAWKMWFSAAGRGAGALVGGRQVFLTTLLNPKALVFAFALVPPGDQALHVLVLSLLAGLIGLGWLALGAALARRAEGRLGGRSVARGTAAALALFAGVLAVQALG